MVVTVEDSDLRTEMEDLESDEKDASRRVLWYKPMSWLGQIRTHHRDEDWSPGQGKQKRKSKFFMTTILCFPNRL